MIKDDRQTSALIHGRRSTSEKLAPPGSAGRLRDHRFRMYGLRSQMLPPGRRSESLDAGFLRRLSQYDTQMELYFHPLRKLWAVYTLVSKGPTPATDFLAHVLTLQGSQGEYRDPGEWVVDELRSRDIRRMYSELDPEQARDKHLLDMDAQEKKEHEENKRRWSDVRREACWNASMAAVERHSEVVGDEKVLVKTKPGRKLIWGKESERIHRTVV